MPVYVWFNCGNIRRNRKDHYWRTVPEAIARLKIKERRITVFYYTICRQFQDEWLWTLRKSSGSDKELKRWTYLFYLCRTLVLEVHVLKDAEVAQWSVLPKYAIYLYFVLLSIRCTKKIYRIFYEWERERER